MPCSGVSRRRYQRRLRFTIGRGGLRSRPLCAAPAVALSRHARERERVFMLQGFRKAGQSWLGKTVITVMFGFLIVSFAIWGIGDIFRQSGPSIVAPVGSTKISPETVRPAYQTELQRMSRQFRRNITPEQARLLGLDRQVLTRL